MPDLRNITLKQLRALSAVVECGSITGAAKALFVTPPAVSTQLRSLEENLGCSVIGRGPGGVTEPTPAGQAVLGATAQIEAILHDCAHRIKALNEGREGYVSVGVVSTGKYFAPALVAQLRNDTPDIEVGLKVGNRGEIIRALMQNEIELAVMGRPPGELEVEADILGDHPYIVIAPPNHPLARLSRVPVDALMRETFLMREQGSGTRIVMTRTLDRLAENQPYRTVVMGTNETIKQAVMAGLGIAFISAHTVTNELISRRLVALSIDGLPFIRRWYLIRRSDAQLSKVAQRFRNFVLGLGGSFLPQLDTPQDEESNSHLNFEHKMDQP